MLGKWKQVVIAGVVTNFVAFEYFWLSELFRVLSF
jgi:hypothetical protein